MSEPVTAAGRAWRRYEEFDQPEALEDLQAALGGKRQWTHTDVIRAIEREAVARFVDEELAGLLERLDAYEEGTMPWPSAKAHAAAIRDLMAKSHG